MSDAIPICICSRCGTPMNDNAFALAVALEKELPESLPQKLRFCPKCIESFERWYRKRGTSSARRARRLQSDGSSASPTLFGSNQSKRCHRRKKQMHRALVVTSLMILVFLAVFYWTWTILKTATQLEE
jgi:hypothetical protein